MPSLMAGNKFRLQTGAGSHLPRITLLFKIMAHRLLSAGCTYNTQYLFMIDVPFSQSNYLGTDQEPAALQQYVHALLARQHALDLLDTIHQQINQVWATIRKLLESTGAAVRATQAVRVARAAQAVQAKNSYRSLERRREECIAALHQAERRANAALQAMLAARSTSPSRKTTDFHPSSSGRSNNRLISRADRQKLKSACSNRG
jgi:hypothetical protein